MIDGKRRLLGFFAIAAMWAPMALHAQNLSKPQQYLYVLHPTKKMQDEKAWTEAENKIVGEHFVRLKAAAERGQVILAGRTMEPLDSTFGLVIFVADSPDEARAFMEADPAVVANLMSATLHPYAIALQRKPQ